MALNVDCLWQFSTTLGERYLPSDPRPNLIDQPLIEILMAKRDHLWRRLRNTVPDLWAALDQTNKTIKDLDPNYHFDPNELLTDPSLAVFQKAVRGADKAWEAIIIYLDDVGIPKERDEIALAVYEAGWRDGSSDEKESPFVRLQRSIDSHTRAEDAIRKNPNPPDDEKALANWKKQHAVAFRIKKRYGLVGRHHWDESLFLKEKDRRAAGDALVDKSSRPDSSFQYR